MDKIKTRIAALLAKAESTESDAEAQALLAKAEQLMLKHAIERSELERKDPRVKREEIVSIKLEYAGAPKGFFVHLGNVGTGAVVNAIGRVECLVWPKLQRLAVVGPKSDAEFTCRALLSVWRAAYAGLLRTRKDINWTTYPSWWKTDFDRGYLVGFCEGVAANIHDQHAEIEAAQPGALALLDRTPEIRAFLGDVRPGRETRTPSLGRSEGIRDGRAHTIAAGALN